MASIDVLVRQILRTARSSIRRHRVANLVAIISLSMAILAVTTVFSGVNGLLFKTPEVNDADSLVELQRIDSAGNPGAFSYPEINVIQQQTRVFGALASYIFDERLPLSISGHASIIGIHFVSSSFFDVLQVRPLKGDYFHDVPLPAGSSPELGVVISYKCWRRLFDGRENVIGESVLIGGQAMMIRAVAPQGFAGLMAGFIPDAWICFSSSPLFMGELSLTDLESRRFVVVGRLDHGLTRPQAVSRLNAMLTLFEKGRLGDNPPRVIISDLNPLPADLMPVVVRSSQFILGAMCLVIVAASTNVGGLLVTRVLASRRDIAIQLALGSSRIRTVTPFIVEALLIALAAGVISVPLVWWTSTSLNLLIPPGTPLSFDFSPDGRVIVVACLLTIVCASIAALISSMAVLTGKPISALQLTAGGTPRASTRALKWQLIIQCATALILISAVCAGASSLRQSKRGILGMSHVNTVILAIDASSDPGWRGKRTLLSQQIIDHLRRTSGVLSVASSSRLPFDPASGPSVSIRGASGGARLITPKVSQAGMDVLVNYVSDDYFATVGAELNGREFARSDSLNERRVAIVNSRLAQTLWPTEGAIGQTLQLNEAGSDLVTVIGVAQSGLYDTLRSAAVPLVYFPSAQAPGSTFNILCLTGSDAGKSGPLIYGAIRDIDLSLPLGTVESMGDRLNILYFLPRTIMAVFGSCASIALILTAIGLYTMINYSTSSRKREIGIRMAVGADRKTIVSLFCKEMIKLLTLGTLMGVVPSLFMLRVLELALGPVTPSYFGAVVIWWGVALLAVICGGVIPIARASKLEPASVLKSE